MEGAAKGCSRDEVIKKRSNILGMVRHDFPAYMHAKFSVNI